MRACNVKVGMTAKQPQIVADAIGLGGSHIFADGEFVSHRVDISDGGSVAKLDIIDLCFTTESKNVCNNKLCTVFAGDGKLTALFGHGLDHARRAEYGVAADDDRAACVRQSRCCLRKRGICSLGFAGTVYVYDIDHFSFRTQECMQNRPCIIGIEAVAAVADQVNTVVTRICKIIRLLDQRKGFPCAGKRENAVVVAVDNEKFSRCDEAAEVTHVKILGNAGNVVATAMPHCNDRIAVGTYRTGGDGDLNALIHAGCIEGRRTAAGISEQHELVKIDLLTKILLQDVDRSRYIPYTLADRRSAIEMRIANSISKTVAASVGGLSRSTHISLLDRYADYALTHCAGDKIGIAGNIMDIVFKFRFTKGYVHTRGMSLQGNDTRQFTCSTRGDKHRCPDEIVLFALELEINARMRIIYRFRYDLEMIVRALFKRQTEQLCELCSCIRGPLCKVLTVLITHKRLMRLGDVLNVRHGVVDLRYACADRTGRYLDICRGGAGRLCTRLQIGVDDRPCFIRIEFASAVADKVRTIVACVHTIICALDQREAFPCTGKREGRICAAADNDKLSRSDQRAKVTHIEIFFNAGDVVAVARMLCDYRILIIAYCTGRNGDLDALVQAGCEECGGAACLIAETDEISFVYKIAEVRIQYVNQSLYVPYALADRRSAVEKRVHGIACSAGCLSGVALACSAHISLVDRDRDHALTNCLQCIVVTGGNVAAELRLTERNVHTRGVSLQGDHARKLAACTSRNEHSRLNEVVRLALELKFHARITGVFGLGQNAEEIVVALFERQTEQFIQLCRNLGSPGSKVGAFRIAHRGFNVRSNILDVVSGAIDAAKAAVEILGGDHNALGGIVGHDLAFAFDSEESLCCLGKDRNCALFYDQRMGAACVCRNKVDRVGDGKDCAVNADGAFLTALGKGHIIQNQVGPYGDLCTVAEIPGAAIVLRGDGRATVKVPGVRTVRVHISYKNESAAILDQVVCAAFAARTQSRLGGIRCQTVIGIVACRSGNVCRFGRALRVGVAVQNRNIAVIRTNGRSLYIGRCRNRLVTAKIHDQSCGTVKGARLVHRRKRGYGDIRNLYGCIAVEDALGTAEDVSPRARLDDDVGIVIGGLGSAVIATVQAEPAIARVGDTRGNGFTDSQLVAHRADKAHVAGRVDKLNTVELGLAAKLETVSDRKFRAALARDRNLSVLCG